MDLFDFLFLFLVLLGLAATSVFARVLSAVAEDESPVAPAHVVYAAP